jgi:DNA-binding XRE family transcriptional regulator
MDDDYSEGWQVRAGARAMANSLEIELRRAEAEQSNRPLLFVGRYLRRSRRYAQLTQRALAADAGLSQSMVSRMERGKAPAAPFDRFLMAGMALGRLFPLGVCPHDHRCAWQPIRLPEPKTGNAQRLIESLLRNAGEG